MVGTVQITKVTTLLGCLALAEDWTERVPLDQLFREAVSRVGLCITWMGELCLISFKSRQ